MSVGVVLIPFIEAHPLWAAPFCVWVVNCVSIDRGLDTRKHACVNPLLSALDYGHSVTSFSLAPLHRWTVTWNCKPNKPFSHKAAFVGII